MRVAIGADHAGYSLKESVRRWVAELGHEVHDIGCHSEERVDYPDFAHDVARRVGAGSVDVGILVCGSGIGMAIAANRHPRVRAANCVLEYQAEMTRRHNDANVLCLGERIVGEGLAEAIVARFLSTTFEGGRHAARVDKIEHG